MSPGPAGSIFRKHIDLAFVDEQASGRQIMTRCQVLIAIYQIVLEVSERVSSLLVHDATSGAPQLDRAAVCLNIAASIE